MINYR